MRTPTSLPTRLTVSSAAAATNTDAPPPPQVVRRPVLTKYTGMSSNSTWRRSASIWASSNQSASVMAPARKAPTMKCRPHQSAPKPQAARHTMPTNQRSFAGRRRIEPAVQPGEHGECAEERQLAADAPPVQQDQREHAPDRDVVETRVAQDALPDRLAQHRHLVQQQDQDGQRRDGAGHADADDELPRLRERPRPVAGRRAHRRRRQAAEEQRRAERKRRGQRGFAPMRPGVAQVELDAGDPHEHHHAPGREAAQQLHDVWGEDALVVVGEDLAQHAGAHQHAADDLDDDQRRPVVGAQQAPDQVRNREDDREGEEKGFGRAHAGGRGARSGRDPAWIARRSGGAGLRAARRASQGCSK